MKQKNKFEQIFLLALGSNERLKWFLQHDVNLVNYLDTYHPKYMDGLDFFTALISKTKIQEMFRNFTAIEILEILKSNRPKLYKTLTASEKTTTWLIKQIQNFKKRFV